MIVTEAKLTEITGYTKNQIKHRRLQAWNKGIHYWADPANTTVYDTEAITAWQTKQRPESETSAENAKFGGGKATSGDQRRYPSPITKLL